MAVTWLVPIDAISFGCPTADTHSRRHPDDITRHLGDLFAATRPRRRQLAIAPRERPRGVCDERYPTRDTSWREPSPAFVQMSTSSLRSCRSERGGSPIHTNLGTFPFVPVTSATVNASHSY